MKVVNDMEYTLTFKNKGGYANLRVFNFETDSKALAFARAYNVGEHGRVVKITKVVAEIEENDFENFCNSGSSNPNEYSTPLILYEKFASVPKRHNITLPFVDNFETKSKLENLLIYIKDFKKIINVVREKF